MKTLEYFIRYLFLRKELKKKTQKRMAALASNPQILTTQGHSNHKKEQFWRKESLNLEKKCGFCCVKVYNYEKLGRSQGEKEWRLKAFWSNVSQPETVEMVPINDVDELEAVLSDARNLSQPIIIECKKCREMVNESNNNNVKKREMIVGYMQLWKEGEMQEEVIGGHKGWLVIEEVRELINKYV
ncbi:hypothetical protein Bca101_012436 [Brassica carinata]